VLLIEHSAEIPPIAPEDLIDELCKKINAAPDEAGQEAALDFV